jgi:hypothetical protein
LSRVRIVSQSELSIPLTDTGGHAVPPEVEVFVPRRLSEAERAELEQLESVIDRAITAFYLEVGRALARIRDEGL